MCNVHVQSLYIWMYSVKGPTWSTQSKKIWPLFEDRVKISDFHIFINSDRTKSRTFTGHLLLFDSTFCSCTKVHSLRTKICWSIKFHIVKKNYQNFKNFLKMFFFKFFKSNNSISFSLKRKINAKKGTRNVKINYNSLRRSVKLLVS